MGLREAVAQSLRMGGTQLLSQPNRFLSFLLDLMDRESREAKVVSFQINDELLAPLERAAQNPTRESLEMARAIVHNMLCRERGIDENLSGVVADGLAGGLADFLGMGYAPHEGGAKDRETEDVAAAHTPGPPHEYDAPNASQTIPTSQGDRTTRVVSPPPSAEQPTYDTMPTTSTVATSTTPTRKRRLGLVVALVSLAVVAMAVVAIVVSNQRPAPSNKSDDGQAVQADEGVAEADAKNYGKGYVFTQLLDPHYPPYEYLDDNKELTGFDVELARAVCDYYGWKYAASTTAFDAILSKLNEGEGSCAWSGISKTPEREEYCIFSKPYVESHFTYEGEDAVGEYAVAFRKEDTELCELVNNALDALSANGTVRKIADKYLKDTENTREVLLL